MIGMFAYLGTAYDTSIRLSAIQGYTPLKTSIGFFCLNVMGVILFPVSTRMIERFNPGWVLAAGMGLIGVGDLVLAAIPATHLSIAAVAVPLLVVGAGFKLSVTSITVVAVNSVPTSQGRHGQRRDQHAARLRPDPRPGHRRRDRAHQRRERHQRQDRRVAGPAGRAQRLLRRSRRTCRPPRRPPSRRPWAR